MMSRNWEDVSHELDCWAMRGLKARFWVRDDDACEMSAPLQRLHELATRYDIIIGLAVIPAKVHPSLLKFMAHEGRRFHPMCHGWQHTNHSPGGHKPAEFGKARPISASIRDARCAFDAFREHFAGHDAVFVPPFGQISAAMRRALPAIGFAGVSTGPGWLERKLSHLPSLAIRVPRVKVARWSSIPRLDVHIDPIDWQTGTAHSADTICDAIMRSLRPRRMGLLASEIPVGLVTHHLVHDDRIWGACDDALDVVRNHRAAEFVHVGQFFRTNAPKEN